MKGILFVTCCDNGLFCLRRMVAAGHAVSAVVTIPPELGARHNVSGYVDVRPWCDALGIPVISLSKYAFGLAELGNLRFDIVVVNGWNRLIPAEVIEAAPLGGVGLHAGHPPIGLGRAPLVWNILLGHQDLEVYAFALTPDADNGDILALQTVEITPYDSVRTLYEKVMLVGADLIKSTVESRQAGRAGIKQNLTFARHYEKRTPEDGLIDFSLSAENLHNFIRAQSSPYPGAFTYLNGRKWIIQKAIPFDRFAYRDRARTPGLIVEAIPSGLVVLTGGAPLWILEAERDGQDSVQGGNGLEHLIGQRFSSTGGE